MSRALGAAALMLVGCTHSMEISNIPELPFSNAEPGRPVSVAVVNRSGGEAEPYVEAAARRLDMSAGVSRVTYPSGPDQSTDVIAYLDVTPTYRAAATNFLVN